MPAPLLAAATIVGGYITKHGIKKAVKKYGKKAVDKITGQKKLNDGQKKVKKATNAQRVTKNTKNQGRTEGVVTTAAAGGAVASGKDAAAKKSKPTEFEKAFSAAHNAGKETFTFKGKKYNTKVKKGK